MLRKQRHGMVSGKTSEQITTPPPASCAVVIYYSLQRSVLLLLPKKAFLPLVRKSGIFRTVIAMNFLHRILDYCLSLVKLIKNQEVGWRTVNRKTGKQGREQQPILKKIKLLFLFSRFVEWVDVTQAMRLWIHDKTIQEGTSWGV